MSTAARPRGYGQIRYSRPSDKVEPLGGGKPGSRPHHWLCTSVPGTLSAGSGKPPSKPWAKAFMSIAYTPVQLLAGSAVPPELLTGVRLIGVLTHSVPPWKGTLARPEMP